MAGTSYLEVYTSAITEFQDPQLKALYENDIMLFTQVMGNFMLNAISLFSKPIGVRKRLSKKKSPYKLSKTFTGDGCNKKFYLDTVIDGKDVEFSLFTIKISNKKYEVEYDNTDNCIVLPFTPALGEEFVLSIYYVGAFENELYPEEIYILSQWLMVCWSEYVNNNRMDIDRLLGDTDFKLSSNSTTTTSKTGWYIVNRETATKRMLNYAWDSAVTGRYK